MTKQQFRLGLLAFVLLGGIGTTAVLPGCGFTKLFTGDASEQTVSQARLAYGSALAALATASDTRAELIAAGHLTEEQSTKLGDGLRKARETLFQARSLLGEDDDAAAAKIAEAQGQITETQTELNTVKVGGGL